MEVCMNIDFISSKPAFFPQPFFMGHSILVQVTVGIFFFSKKQGILDVGNKPKALCVRLTHCRCVWGLRKKSEAPLASDFFR